MQRVAGVIVASVLASAAACGRPATPAPPEPVCEPLGAAEYEHARAMGPLTAEAYNKFGFDLHLTVLVMEQRVFGDAGAPPGQPPLTDALVRDRCVPATFEVLLTIAGGDPEPLEAIGFHVTSLLGGRDRPRSYVTGRISTARIVDLVRLPQVIQIEGSQPGFYEHSSSP